MSLSKKTKSYVFILIILFIYAGSYLYKTYSNPPASNTPTVQNTQNDESIKNVVQTIPQEKEITPQGKYKINKDLNLIPINPTDSKKVVLLTIDDGPSKQSESLMAILAKHEVKVIFFINGMNHKNYPTVIQKEYEAGHAIGNHTWSHKNLKQQTQDVIEKEISDTTKLIYDTTGQNPQFFRAPFGINTPFVNEYIKKENMISMNWSGSTLDWEKSARAKDVLINNVMKDLHDGTIILMHEHPWNVEALDELLTEIKDKGYTFLDPKQITQ